MGEDVEHTKNCPRCTVLRRRRHENINTGCMFTCLPAPQAAKQNHSSLAFIFQGFMFFTVVSFRHMPVLCFFFDTAWRLATFKLERAHHKICAMFKGSSLFHPCALQVFPAISLVIFFRLKYVYNRHLATSHIRQNRLHKAVTCAGLRASSPSFVQSSSMVWLPHICREARQPFSSFPVRMELASLLSRVYKGHHLKESVSAYLLRDSSHPLLNTENH